MPQALATFRDRLARLALAAPAGVVLGTLVLAAPGVGTAAAAADRPNLIFVIADDQGVDAIDGPGWSNELDVHTPVLANLATQGRVFRQARVNPVCSSTRAGFLTGRYAHHNGVTGVLFGDVDDPDYLHLSLQSEEHTLAELLREQGYRTIVIDKWHCGESVEYGHDPESQGFDRAELTDNYLVLDEPLEVGDEHLSRMVDLAVSAVHEVSGSGQPWALFFCSIDPHWRDDPRGVEPRGWWKVRPELLPSGEDYYEATKDNERNRYRAVVEALDTELGRLFRELGVTDPNGRYRPQARTLTFYFSDNGTPNEVAWEPRKSKATLFEGGIRVPFFVFGDGVPRDGLIVDRLVSHVDIYDTVADILALPASMRGDRPRDGVSFADLVGRRSSSPEPRRYQFLSKSRWLPDNHFGVITDGRYKFSSRIGGGDREPYEAGYLFDLEADPAESENLLEAGLNDQQRAVLRALREAMLDHCYQAVPGPAEHVVSVPFAVVEAADSANRRYTGSLPLGHLEPGTDKAVESRMFLRLEIADLLAALPEGVGIEDLESARVVLRFDRDIPAEENGVDTDLIRVFPMTIDWFSVRREWSEVVDAFQPLRELGRLDLPPNIILQPANNMQGQPLPSGTWLGMSNSQALLLALRVWHEYPEANLGVAIIARPDFALQDDQRVWMLPDAELRVTFPVP